MTPCSADADQHELACRRAPGAASGWCRAAAWPATRGSCRRRLLLGWLDLLEQPGDAVDDGADHDEADDRPGDPAARGDVRRLGRGVVGEVQRRVLAGAGGVGRGGEQQAADAGSGRGNEGRGSPHLNRGSEPGSGSRLLSAGAPRSLNRRRMSDRRSEDRGLRAWSDGAHGPLPPAPSSHLPAATRPAGRAPGAAPAVAARGAGAPLVPPGQRCDVSRRSLTTAPASRIIASA